MRKILFSFFFLTRKKSSSGQVFEIEKTIRLTLKPRKLDHYFVQKIHLSLKTAFFKIVFGSEKAFVKKAIRPAVKPRNGKRDSTVYSTDM